ncbi:MAG: Methionine gamma-lyase [Firmicutes bacterium ADurb.Bin182]|nr:MAG: Methionine gamma-lyase [Firmicutes bacterium ADurb.Bin182]
MSNRFNGFATKQIHAAHVRLPGINPLSTPIFQTSTFAFDTAVQGARRFSGDEKGYIYTRLGNPNNDKLAKKIAVLEGAQAGLVTGSGMGAISAVMWTALRAGDHLLADKTLYGCTFSYFMHGLARFGVNVTQTDFNDIESIEKNLRPETKAVYFETPANPNMKIIDIAAVSECVHRAAPGCLVIVDNTFSTPYIQRPIELGADAVVHSGTKYLNGHGDVIAGIAVGREDFISECIGFGLKDMTGAVLSPFDAYLIDRGLKTLDIRMQKHSSSAMEIARFLERHPAVKRVLYPGLTSCPNHEIAKKQMSLFGGMITFELHCGKAAAERFVNELELCTLAVSLGDTETLIQHPASMTHSTYTPAELAAADISENLLRISVGLEDPEDIISDLKRGLDRIDSR